MKKYLLSICFLMLFSSCTSIKKYNEEISEFHSVVALHEDVDKTYQQLKKHHPRLYQYIPKAQLDFKFDSLKQTIKQPMKSKAFYEKLAPVVGAVRQGHIWLLRPQKQFTKKEYKVLKKRKLEINDLDFESIDNKIWVVNTRGEDSTIIGSEVLKMEEELVPELVSKYNTFVASDGYNTTLYNSFVGSRFLSLYYEDKGYIDSLKVQFKKNDSIFNKTFKRIDKEALKRKEDSLKFANTPKAKIKLSKVDKQKRKRAAKKRRKNYKKYGYIPSKQKYTRGFKRIGKDSTIAYMKIRGFTRGTYKKFYNESFKTIDSLNLKHLVIDLRDNGGGRLAEIHNLYSYLTDKEYVFINESEVNSRIPFLKMIMSNTKPNSAKFFAGLFSPIIVAHNLIKTKKKEGKVYYKFKYSKLKPPNPLNFKGKLYVLINGNSFSASSILSTHLKANKRATFVGEETGGAYNGTVAGISRTYKLPNSKIFINMGMMHIDAPQKIEPDGYGVKADVVLKPTSADRFNDKDTELDWIIKDIEDKN